MKINKKRPGLAHLNKKSYVRIIGFGDRHEGLVHQSVAPAEQVRSPGHLQVDGAQDNHLAKLQVVVGG